MAGHDIILIGGSAGSISALLEIVSDLPANFPAAVLVVIHVSPVSTSQLPAILTRHGKLPATHAIEGDTIQPGHIYVAPSDYHMLVREGKISLSHGPRENRVRPAIDPLFRSAARTYAKRAVGIVLSDSLGDGSTGLMAIKAYGGVTVVQNPQEALYNSMPNTAMRFAEVDYVLPVAEIGPLLVRLATEPVEEKGAFPMSVDVEEISPVIQRDKTEQEQNRRGGQTSVVVCPDCGGVLWQINNGSLIQFQCHVGHIYSPDMLLVQKTEELEDALWACVRMLTEKAILTRQTATRMRESGDAARAERIDEQAELDERHIHLIRDMILQSSSNPMTETLTIEEILQGQPPSSLPPDQPASENKTE